MKALCTSFDDIIMTRNNKNVIDKLKMKINREFKIKKLGNLKSFLRIEVSRSKRWIHIYQRRYALNILKGANILGVITLTRLEH